MNGTASGTERRGFDMGPAIVIAATAIIALAVVVGLAIFYRDSGFTVIVDKEGKVVLDFQSNEVSLAEILDQALTAKDGGNTERDFTEALLERRGYYHITNLHLVDALRSMGEEETTRRLTSAMRSLLYDLQGPFARPHTLLGARDDRLLTAFEDLDRSEEVSPLLSGLWRMSLNFEGIFRPRTISTTVQAAARVKGGRASTCIGSVLGGKEITVFAEGRSLSVFVDGDWPCAARSPQQLLAGATAELRLAPDDFTKLVRAVDSQPQALQASLIVAPKYFATMMSAGS